MNTHRAVEMRRSSFRVSSSRVWSCDFSGLGEVCRPCTENAVRFEFKSVVAREEEEADCNMSKLTARKCGAGGGRYIATYRNGQRISGEWGRMRSAHCNIKVGRKSVRGWDKVGRLQYIKVDSTSVKRWKEIGILQHIEVNNVSVGRVGGRDRRIATY